MTKNELKNLDLVVEFLISEAEKYDELALNSSNTNDAQRYDDLFSLCLNVSKKLMAI